LDRIPPGEAIPHGAMPGKVFDEALLMRHSGVSQAHFPPSDFSKKKKNTVLAYVRRNTCSELTYEGQIFFDVYTDWHCIRQEVFAAILN
jgi:hypothetical protein